MFIFTDNNAGYTRAQIDSLRGLAAAAGVANPYVVVLYFAHAKASSFAPDIGADAISAYVTYRSGGAPYSN